MVEMTIETMPMDPALKGVVRSIVLRRRPQNTREFRALIPSNMGIIACYFNNSVQEIQGAKVSMLDTPTLFGLQTQPRFFQDSRPYEAILIHLTPYGLAAMLGKETPEIVDQSIILPQALSSWFKPWGMQDPSFKDLDLYQKGQLIQKNLVRFFQDRSAPPILKKAVDKIEEHHGNLSIKDLCQYLDLTRQGLAYFGKRYMGLSLKVFSRIERLKYALNLIEEGYSWMEIIKECGFFDYSHLTKEIKAFTEMKVAEIKKLLTMDNSEITRFFKKQANCHYFYISESADPDKV